MNKNEGTTLINSRAGRMNLDHAFTKLVLNIPVKKNIPLRVILFFLLTGWFFFEYLMIQIGTAWRFHARDNLFGILLFIIWTGAGFEVIHALLRNLFGKQKLIIGKEKLEIIRSRFLFKQCKSFEIDGIRRMSATGDREFPIGSPGGLLFKYQDKWHSISLGLDVVDAQYILQRLKENQLLTGENF